MLGPSTIGPKTYSEGASVSGEKCLSIVHK